MSAVNDSQPIDALRPSHDKIVRPKAIIIGAQKGGTTALFEYLSAHPLVCPPSEKEINFFMCPSLHAQGNDFYHQYFPKKTDDNERAMSIDASPNYLVSRDAAQRIYEYDPQMKIIALLREPVARAYSAWHMYRRFFRKKPNWYFEWMQRCDATIDITTYERRNESFGESFYDDASQEIRARDAGRPIEGPFLRHGCYEEQIPFYRRRFPESQIYIESSERFRAATQDVLQEIAAFLDIESFRWNRSDLSPVFVGDYSEMPQDRGTDLVREFYSERRAKLFEILGRSMWERAGPARD